MAVENLYYPEKGVHNPLENLKIMLAAGERYFMIVIKINIWDIKISSNIDVSNWSISCKADCRF